MNSVSTCINGPSSPGTTEPAPATAPRGANLDYPESPSMRSKEDHLTELEAAYGLIRDAMQRIRATRMNVPMGSHVHKRLARHEEELFEVRGGVWFTFQTLAQNGYGDDRRAS